MLYENYDFLEKFKALEKLCNEIYDAKNGVTCYINEMNERYDYTAASIPNWKEDYRMLKRLRHIRNQLTHDVGTLETQMCTSADIEYLVEFRLRILKRNDPLAMLTKAKKNAVPTYPTEYYDDEPPYRPHYPHHPHNPDPSSFDTGGFIIVLLSILSVIIFLWVLSSK